MNEEAMAHWGLYCQKKKIIQWVFINVQGQQHKC